MSFADGVLPRAATSATSALESVKSSIFAVSANVASIERMINQLGTNKDSLVMREKLENLTHATQALIKKTMHELKETAHKLSDGVIDEHQFSARKLEHQKISKDFEAVLKRFNEVQRVATEKSRETISKARLQSSHIDPDAQDESSPLAGESDRFEMQQQQELQRLDTEIEYNESLIVEREQSIIEIEQSIYEVNEIFRDLGTLVNDQQGLIDNIESNIEQGAVHTGGAVLELERAENYQKKARNRMCCLFVTAAIVLTILILVIVLEKR